MCINHFSINWASSPSGWDWGIDFYRMIKIKIPVYLSTASHYVFWPVFLVILYLSFANNKAIARISTEGTILRLDYVFHFLAYMGLVILYKTGNPRAKGFSFLLSSGVIATLLMAIFTEAAQFYIPWRTFNWFDMAMNVGGVALGLLISILYKTTGK